MRYKFQYKDNKITFYCGGMKKEIEVPKSKVDINHSKGNITLTSNDSEGYAYEPVFVNGSKLDF
jgi:hypothetical protein